MTGLLMIAPLIGILIAVLIGYNAHSVGRLLHVLDYPDPVGGRKRHAKITPLVGGVVVALTLVFMLVLIQILAHYGGAEKNPVYSWLLVVALGMFLVGFLDDRLHLSPVPRLIISIALFMSALHHMPSFELSFLYFSFLREVSILGALTTVFTLVCLVGLVNAVNMADGKNGLVVGMALIWSVLLFLSSTEALTPVYAALSAALAVLMYFNLRSDLFLGDGGSYGIAGFMGVSAIYAYNQNFVHLSADQVALWFLVPVLDCLRLMIKRIMAGRSPFSGDRDHLHHHLAHYFSWELGLLIYLSLVGIPAFVSWYWPQSTLLNIFMVAVIYVGIMIMTVFKARKGGFAPV